MRMRSLVVMTVMLIAASATLTQAAVPTLLTAEGRLTNAAGNPLPSGPYKLTFRIFSRETGGTEIWPRVPAEELHLVTLGNDGLWSVRLGAGFPISDTHFAVSSRWLEVTVEGAGKPPETLPRVQMTTTPFSHRVSTIDQASGGDIFGNIYLHSNLTVGESGDAGSIDVRSSLGAARIHMDGETGYVDVSGRYRVYSSLGATGVLRTVLLGGSLRTYSIDGTTSTSFTASSGSGGGYQYIYQADGDIGTYLDGDDGNSGRVSIRNAANATTVILDGDDGLGGSYLSMTDGSVTTVLLDAEELDGGGSAMFLYNHSGSNTIEIDGDEGNVGVMRLSNNAGETRIRMHATGTSSGGDILLYDEDGTSTVDIQASEGVANGGQITLRTATGTSTIILDAEHGTGGTGRVITPVLQITGGADLSEQFEVHGAGTGVSPDQGMVVCLDPANPGELIVSSSAYDRTVAGIVSGAGGVNTGMLMGQTGSEADGQHPIALSGRVYVRADATGGAIAVGDLLTTSDMAGYAMKVTDYDRAQGAIIGKAMTPLADGDGLVLVLVSLQ